MDFTAVVERLRADGPKGLSVETQDEMDDGQLHVLWPAMTFDHGGLVIISLSTVRATNTLNVGTIFYRGGIYHS